MPMFRKKPVVIEARRFDADGANGLDLVAWSGGKAAQDAMGRIIEIDTPEGTMIARPGDWIIKGVQGEFYPCKPDIFAATYEAAIPAGAEDFKMYSGRDTLTLESDESAK